ncbi:MAG: protein kinase [Polyangiaceae bacterium]|jgi:serine/threonine protein kinase|nr:protein kinase [Polyangiaceae bacterium]
MSHAPLCPSCSHRGKPADAYCSECGFPLGQARAEEGATDALVGRTLSGGYRVVEPLAEGSMGRVYRAEQSTLGRQVAVKVMSSGFLGNDEMIQRFKNEARAASALNHPNCVRVYDFGTTNDGRPYFVMELLTGQDLEAILAAEPLQPVTRVLDISLQILGALEEAHGLGVVHRDLKPGNVFVMPQRGGGDLVKVVDFGLAKLKSGISTQTGRVFGTPEYITPEQAMAKETDERTDLYACGVMLFEMIAGRLPFLQTEPRELLEAHAFEAPPKLASLAAERSMFGLDAVVERALSKDPIHRYQKAFEFADALREIVAYRTGERSVSDRRSWVRTAFKACSLCGNLNAPHARFCGECGETLERESALPPVSMPMATTGPVSRPVTPAPQPRSDVPPQARVTAREGRGSVPRSDSERPPRSVSATLEHSIREVIEEATESGDPGAALVFLEQIATDRLKAGDPNGAILALKRGIDLARADLDNGELDDPIRVVAIFSGKLGEAYFEASEPANATRALKDALALSRNADERARTWTLLSRVAKSQGHDEEASSYLESASREVASSGRRTSDPPQAANDSTRRKKR